MHFSDLFRHRRVRSKSTEQKFRFSFERLEPRKMLSGPDSSLNVCFLDEAKALPPANPSVQRIMTDEVVGDYQDDFQTPNPPGNWQYLWNENGEFGDPSNYTAMTWETWRYRPDGPSFPYLGATSGHSGHGLDDADSGGIERYAIAAFTVSTSGEYAIGASTITRAGVFGDGVEVSVHINDLEVTELLQLAPESTGSFDTALGMLAEGDTIYVGIGPDGPNPGSGIGNDGVGWDFSILKTGEGEPDQVTVTVDLNTQRYVGDVSALDRQKYFTFHSSGGGNDQQIQDFMDEYDVYTGRQFWGPIGYAKSQTGQAGVYPDITPSTDNSVRPANRIIQTSHPRDALRWDTDLQAAADWVTTYYTTVVNSVPEFFEPINEPFVHANDSEFSDAPDAQSMRVKMAEFYAAIGEAVHDHPALANINMVGYSSAWPSVELWDFGHWDTRMKMFMDVAGEHMDAFSTHLYDGVNVTGQNNRRSGSNSEAILDLIETYSFAKWGTIKPHAITEYGGIEQGYGDAYNDIGWAQSIRSINHLMFNLLEREDDMVISIPFISDKATWFLDPANDCQPYGATLFRPDNPDLTDCSGDFTYTWRINFFELWQNVQGERGLIRSSDPDVQTQLFVYGNTAYVAVNNLSDATTDIDLDFVSGLPGFQDVEIRRLEVPVSADLEPTYTETTLTTAPDSVTLNTGGTAVLVYNFDGPLEFSKSIRSEKYYTSEHLQPINANEAITFNINNVQTASEGEAILRMGIGRKHNVSKAPVLTVNDTVVEVPTDWKGYDQSNRDDFFGVIEIPVPIELLSADNTISVTFPDDGGRVSSMILNVEAFDVAPTLSDVMINIGDSDRSDVNQLTLNFDGLVDFGSDAFSVIQRSDFSGVTGTSVDTSFASQVVDGNTVVTISFDSMTRNGSGSLLDGNYQLTVNAASVTSSTNGLSMGEDFVFGDTEDESFYAYYGDGNGDRLLDVFDFIPFRSAWNSASSSDRYVASLDYGADGVIDIFDFIQFRTRWATRLAFA